LKIIYIAILNLNNTITSYLTFENNLNITINDDKTKIMEIMRRKDIDNVKKQKLIQEIHNKNISINKQNDNFDWTCEHYDKKCSQFTFDCCKIIDPCRRCHMERAENYDLNTCKNPIVKTITCTECKLQQIPTEKCINLECNIKFSKNYCTTCQLWTKVDIVHCDKCTVCRVGTDLFHCDICDICYNNSFPHICPGFNLRQAKCVACMQDAYSAQHKSHLLQCKHIIHEKCMNNIFLQNNYRCPLCRKAMIDMTMYWHNLRNNINLQPMPKLYTIKHNIILNSPYGKFKVTSQDDQNNKLFIGQLLNIPMKKENTYATATIHQNNLENISDINILCYDCDKKSTTKFHFLGLECMLCGSFNTSK